MKVLLSIRPQFSDKIFEGSKGFEFRRRGFRLAVNTVVVYATLPIGRIVGEFDIETILVDAPHLIWKETCDRSGITRSFFDAYYEGREKAYALQIGERRQYAEPRRPEEIFDNFSAPQSYMYLREDDSLLI